VLDYKISISNYYSISYRIISHYITGCAKISRSTLNLKHYNYRIPIFAAATFQKTTWSRIWEFESCNVIQFAQITQGDSVSKRTCSK